MHNDEKHIEKRKNGNKFFSLITVISRLQNFMYGKFLISYNIQKYVKYLKLVFIRRNPYSIRESIGESIEEINFYLNSISLTMFLIMSL